MPKHPGGRPPKYTAAEIEQIAADFKDYIDRTADPTVVGFTAYYTKYPVHKQYMSDRQEFSDLVKRAIEKQEAYLLAGASVNRVNPTIAIFRLKQPQHAYRDRTEVDQTINGNVTFVNDVPRPRKNP